MSIIFRMVGIFLYRVLFYPRIEGLKWILKSFLREKFNPNCEANNLHKIYNPINQNNLRIKKSYQL